MFVEVRSQATGRFGTPEESITGTKLRALYRAAINVRRAGALPDGAVLPRTRWRVDLVAVEHGSDPSDGPRRPAIRHLRDPAP